MPLSSWGLKASRSHWKQATQNIATFLLPQPPQLGGGIKLLCFSIHTACNPLCLNIRLRTIYGGCGRSNRLFSLFFPHHPLHETFPCSRSKQNRRNRPGVFLFFFFFLGTWVLIVHVSPGKVLVWMSNIQEQGSYVSSLNPSDVGANHLVSLICYIRIMGGIHQSQWMIHGHLSASSWPSAEVTQSSPCYYFPGLLICYRVMAGSWGSIPKTEFPK